MQSMFAEGKLGDFHPANVRLFALTYVGVIVVAVHHIHTITTHPHPHLTLTITSPSPSHLPLTSCYTVSSSSRCTSLSRPVGVSRATLKWWRCWTREREQCSSSTVSEHHCQVDRGKSDHIFSSCTSFILLLPFIPSHFPLSHPLPPPLLSLPTLPLSLSITIHLSPFPPASPFSSPPLPSPSLLLLSPPPPAPFLPPPSPSLLPFPSSHPQGREAGTCVHEPIRHLHCWSGRVWGKEELSSG